MACIHNRISTWSIPLAVVPSLRSYHLYLAVQASDPPTTLPILSPRNDNASLRLSPFTPTPAPTPAAAPKAVDMSPDFNPLKPPTAPVVSNLAASVAPDGEPDMGV